MEERTIRAKDYYGNEVQQTGENISVLRECQRTWMVVFNNPDEHGIDNEFIAKTLEEACNNGIIQYWACIREESVETNSDTGEKTPHLHLIIYFPNKQRGGWLHKRFPTGALFVCAANVPSLIQYIKKDTKGAWYKRHPEKLAEKLPEKEAQFIEWGVMPQGKKGASNVASTEIVQAINSGKSDFELLQSNPNLWKSLAAVKQTRAILQGEKFLHCFRDVDVIYIEGPSGTGKTRSVMQETNYNVFTVDDYAHPWDGYSGEDCVCFDEFRGQVDFSQMLRWLDGNPVKLPARYSNPVACYTKVFVVSSWPLEQQYEHVQKKRPRDWTSFLRRIKVRRVYSKSGDFQDFEKNANNEWVLSENKECDKDCTNN